MNRLCKAIATARLAAKAAGALSAGVALCGLMTASAWAQAAAAKAAEPVHGAEATLVPAPLPDLKLPNLNDLRLSVPRPVQAASSLLGYGRQRLALVVGIGTLGSRQVLDSAARDTQAVATALRAGGFVVMVREDVNSTDLRAALKEYGTRMQPGGVGFVYVTGLGAQIDGQNLLLARDTRLDDSASAAEVASQVKASAVPLQEVVDALMSTPDSARMLVVDAAYTHPALAKLPKAGLAEQRLPPGMLALFGHALAAAQEVPAAAPLPTPVPKDPREIASTRFARVLVGTLVTPRVSANDALRQTHRALIEGAPDLPQPWLGGQSDNKEDLAEASLLDGLFPRTPEDLAREAFKQIARAAVRDSGGGAVATAGAAPAVAPEATLGKPAGPTQPAIPSAPPGGASVLGTVTNTLGTAASVAGTVASVAAGAATVAAGAQAMAAVETVSTVATAATAATTAVNVVGSAAGSALNTTARILSSNSGGEAARQAVQQVAAQSAPAAAAATTSGTAAAAATTAAAAPALGAPALAAPTLAAPAVPGAALAPTAPLGTGLAAGSVQGSAALTTPPGAPLAAPAGTPAAAPGSPLTPPANAAPGAPAAPEAAGAPATPATAPGTPPAQAPAAPAADTPAGNAPPNALDGRTQRTANGGERPVYNPRTNRYGYSEGDTFTYQVVDGWKEEVIGSFTTSIEEVLGDGQLLANGQATEMDAQGRVKRQRRPDGSVASFEPHQDLWWSNPKPGQTRDVKFKELIQRGNRPARQLEFEGSSSVGKLRKIETPAGEFEAMPIETTGYFEGQFANGVPTGGQFTRTVWYSPKLGHPVRIDITDSDRMGKLLVRERVELMHAQRVPQP